MKSPMAMKSLRDEIHLTMDEMFPRRSHRYCEKMQDFPQPCGFIRRFPTQSVNGRFHSGLRLLPIKHTLVGVPDYPADDLPLPAR